MAVIRHAAYRVSPILRRHGFEREDIEQELALHWVRQRHRHDARLSSAPTFAAHLCRGRSSQLIEAARAQKRGAMLTRLSLSDRVHLDKRHTATAVTSLVDTISAAEHALCTGARHRSAVDLLMLHVEVSRAVNGLPAELAGVAQHLAAGEAVVEVAHSLGVSRATIHRRIGQLRFAFRRAGLEQHVSRGRA
jgi:hypothetical protein